MILISQDAKDSQFSIKQQVFVGKWSTKETVQTFFYSRHLTP